MSDADKEEVVSKVQQITAQPTTITVLDQEFEIHPLENKEFLSFIAQNKGRNQEGGEDEMIIDIVTMILQKDDSNITKEHVEEAPMALITKTVDAMEQVNGLEDFFEKAAAQM